MAILDILESLPSKNGFAIGNGLCELGKIKIGGKSKTVRTSGSGNKWRAPEKYDHFVITTMNRDGDGDLVVDKTLMEQLLAEHGDTDGKLRRIPIRLLSDSIDDVIQSAFVWYGGKTIGARSDGKTITWFNDHCTGSRMKEPVEEPWNPEYLDLTNKSGVKLIKVHSNFSCVIAAKEARWGGVYKFRTTSVISLRQLHGSLLHLLQLTGGILVGMPLMLVVRPMQVAPDGKPSTVHVVHVELRGGDMMQLQQNALEMAKFRLAFADQIQNTQRQYRRLLALPGNETPEEAQDITTEFVPESPDIQGVAPEQSYGLLDDAPAPDTTQVGIQMTEPPQVEDFPTDNQVAEYGNEGQQPSADEQAEADPVWKDNAKAEKRCREQARDVSQIGRADFNGGLWKFMNPAGQPKILPSAAVWHDLFIAITEKRFDYATGKVNQPV